MNVAGTEKTSQPVSAAAPSPIPTPAARSEALATHAPTIAVRPRYAPRSSLGATLWFVWMVAMWLTFFVLLVANRLDGLWSAIRHLPLFVEIVLWVAFLPWMLGMAVWTSSWADWLRGLLVLCFAVGWTLLSIPRGKKVRSL
jgi:hypothetical protein